MKGTRIHKTLKNEKATLSIKTIKFFTFNRMKYFLTYPKTFFVFMLSDTKKFEIERGVQMLNLTGKRRVQLRAGSEVNLVSVGAKPAKQSSFRRSLAFCTERAQVTLHHTGTCPCDDLRG